MATPQKLGVALRSRKKFLNRVREGCANWHVPNEMKFFYVYVLRSLPKNFIYVGFTTDLKRRPEEHNSGSEFSTKPYVPYELIFYEAYRNIKDAKRREEYFKTTKGKTTLRTMLKEFLSKN